MQSPGVDLATRFWRYVDKRGRDECWEWTGSRSPLGYGALRVTSGYRQSKSIRASRIALFLDTGNWPPERLFVLHTCDNPPCVNPAHLRVGTQRDNVADMISRGRANRSNQARGEQINTAVLTEASVRTIRQRASNGESLRSLAKEYGVVWYTIWAAVHRRTWKHVE